MKKKYYNSPPKVLAIIPARGGSKGVPMKNIKKLGGKPLIYYSISLAMKINEINNVIISTDNDKIAEISKRFGAEVPFKRPKKLSGDFVGDLPVLKHSLLNYEKKSKTKFDFILMLQPTSPFRDTKIVIDAINKIIKKNYDSVWSISPIDKKYHPDKQLIKNLDTINYFSKKGNSIIARQQLFQTYIRDGRVYALTRKLVISNKNLLGKKAGFVISKNQYVNIDTFEDFKKSENLLAKI